MAWFSPFIYVPYYLVAIYAFIFEKEWIRVPSKSTVTQSRTIVLTVNVCTVESKTGLIVPSL